MLEKEAIMVVTMQVSLRWLGFAMFTYVHSMSP